MLLLRFLRFSLTIFMMFRLFKARERKKKLVLSIGIRVGREMQPVGTEFTSG